jgi:alanine-alpha-ketoisovalerate/valine-pyruvate aminotransferase
MLTSLDISRAGVDQGNVLTDEGVVALIEQVGENLIQLVLDRMSFNFPLTNFTTHTDQSSVVHTWSKQRIIYSRIESL